MVVQAALAKPASMGLAMGSLATKMADNKLLLLGLLGVIIMDPWVHMICSNLAKILILMGRMMILMILMMMTNHLIQ